MPGRRLERCWKPLSLGTSSYIFICFYWLVQVRLQIQQDDIVLMHKFPPRNSWDLY